MSVSIYDIAKKANVAPSTVSRALQNHPRIGSETREYIQKLAKEMGFVPSDVAKNLASNKTWTIGMVVTAISDPFMGQVVEGVEQVAHAAGYNVFLSTSRNDPAREAAVVEAFQRRRVDAIIIIASHLTNLYRTQLDQMQIPIVLVNNEEEGKYLHSVAIDFVQGARLAVEHLITLGHRRIGYLHAYPSSRRSSQSRLIGYQAALKNAGIIQDSKFVFSLEIENDVKRGEAGLESLIATDATAVLCYNDLTAIGVLRACRKRGISVPDDLSVIGFDNIEPATYTVPTLTTVCLPRLEQLGQLAMTMALDLLNGQPGQDRILDSELVIRESTGEYLHH